MSSLKLIIIRHCRTLENDARIVQGQGWPGRLSLKGKEQAKVLAGLLRQEQFEAVYSSDLGRAVETAKIIMRERERPDIVFDSRLREQCFGVYEGGPLITMIRRMRRMKVGPIDFNPQMGESAVDFHSRVNNFLGEIKAKHFGKAIVLITHTNVINIILDKYSRQVLKR